MLRAGGARDWHPFDDPDFPIPWENPYGNCADAPPLSGEDARYEQVLAVIETAELNPELKKAMGDEATKAETGLIGPLMAVP
jgi:hypothetical protein